MQPWSCKTMTLPVHPGIFFRSFVSSVLNAVGHMHCALSQDQAQHYFPLKGWSLWSLWEMRNDCVFNNATPNCHELVRSILDEAKLWLLAGAKELGRLPLHTRPPNA